MPGPPRTPTATLLARGSTLAGSRQGEVQYERGLPKPPPWLTTEGKRAWLRLADQLTAAGIVQQVDADLLAMYCEQLGEVERLSKAVKKHGDDAGLLKSRRQAIEAAYKLGQQFGFSPASRSRVQGGEEKTNDDSRNGKPFPCGL